MESGEYKEYEIETTDGMTVLDAVHKIQKEVERVQEFRKCNDRTQYISKTARINL